MKITKIISVPLLAFGLSNPTIAQVDYKAAADQLSTAGNVALSSEDSFAALKLFEQSLVANPKHLAAYMGLAKTHFTLGNDEEGFKYFDTALLIDPTYLPALEGKALEYLKRNSLDEARIAFAIIQKFCEIRACEEVLTVTEALASYEKTKEEKIS